MTTDEHAPQQWKDRTLLGWKAWYTDGTTYASDKYKWGDIPQRHFAFVKKYYLQKDDKVEGGERLKTQILSSHDIFIISDEYRDSIEIQKEIKIGEWMEDDKFHEMYNQARDEEEFVEVMI